MQGEGGETEAALLESRAQRSRFGLGPLSSGIFVVCAAIALLRADTSHAGEIACGAEHVVEPGETLSRLAFKAYGDRLQWPAIVEANKDQLRPALIAPGQRLFIPCLDAVGSDGDPTAKAVPAPTEATPPGTLAGTAGEAAATDPSLAAPGETLAGADAPEASSSATQPAGEGDATTMAAVVPAVSTPSGTRVEPLTQLNLLTSDNFVPFADRALLNGGLITELITQALRRDLRTAQLPQNLFWINDRRSHQRLLTGGATFDIGFPWIRLDCTESDQMRPPMRELCERFYFSDPLIEEMNRLFVLRTSSFAFETDSEIVGKRVCASTDREVDDLDSNGREWVASNKIVLLRPGSEVECFDMLRDGEVDVVYAPELVGLAMLDRLNLGSDVRTLQRPVSIVSLSAIVPRNHPHADEIIRSINSGIALLRSGDIYDTIVAQHLEQYWETRKDE